MEDSNKTIRVLDIYNKFKSGGVINKSYEANKYGVNERTIQRDIEDIRKYMESEFVGNGMINSIVYDRLEKGYRMERIQNQKLSNSEVLAICKILLDSRAFLKKEMDSIIDKLLDCCLAEEGQEIVRDLIANEQYHYIELLHKKDFLDTLWQVGQAIEQQRYIEISYTRINENLPVRRTVRPAAIMFSEFYFYMAAFIDDEKAKKKLGISDDEFPTIYRIDRIKNLTMSDEKFHVLYKNRFEEGEFRKRVQFMFGGKLQRIKFKCSKYSLEAVLDRLPTAEVLEEREDGCIITAEVYGEGINMWLRSQGKNVEVLSEYGKEV